MLETFNWNEKEKIENWFLKIKILLLNKKLKMIQVKFWYLFMNLFVEFNDLKFYY